MAIDWRPVSEARRQEIYLVGNEDYRGWFVVAALNALGEWRVDRGQDLLPYPVTHIADLTPIVDDDDLN